MTPVENLFANFFASLDDVLSRFVSTKVQIVAAAIEPAAMTLATISICMFALMCIAGRMNVMDGVLRLVIVVGVVAVGLRLALYNEVVVDTFTNGPNQLAQRLLGAPSPVGLLDKIWMDANLAGQSLWKQAGVLSGDFGYYFAAAGVYGIAIVIVGTMGEYLGLARIAGAILLAVGPVAIVLVLFTSTKRFFELWLQSLANYAWLMILASVVGALVLDVVVAFFAAAASSGTSITIAEVVRIIVITYLIYKILKHTPSMAAGLSAGVAMATGTVSNAIHGAMRSGGQAARGVMDISTGNPRSRHDSMPRLAGSMVGQVARGAVLATGDLFRQSPGGTVSRDRVMPPRTR